jgi:RecA-family ATPase
MNIHIPIEDIELAERLRQILDDVRVAPPSGRYSAWARAARRVRAEVVGTQYSWREAVDRLWHTAECFGLVRECGEDTIQAELAAAAEERTRNDELDAKALDKEREAELSALPVKLVSTWQGVEVKPQRWLVKHRVPMRKVTLLNGDGAAGKTTIMLQLCASIDLELEWLGAMIEEPGPALFFTGEEEEDEIHRRIARDLEHRGLEFSALRRFHCLCMPHEDVTLGAPNANGVIQATKMFDRLREATCDIRPKLLAIEAAADVFAGNENNRTQVKQFMAMLGRLALEADTAMLLAQHPSLSGINAESGMSGSTQWNNAARSRLYFTANKIADGDQSDLRELRVMKSNYGPPGEIVRLRWQNGVFVPLTSPSEIERAASEAAADAVFLACLDARRAQGIEVVPTAGRGYAPADFAAMAQAKGCNKKALTQAMERLLTAGKIRHAVVGGPPSRPKKALIRAN